MARFSLAFLLFLFVPACGGDDDGAGDGGDSGDGSGDPDGGGGGGGADADLPDGFESLLTIDWTIPPPQGSNPDEYICARLTVDQDMLLAGFSAISPLGTHHTVLSVGEPAGPDGQFDCAFFQNHETLLFASGVGTDDFLFPEGVALPVEAGQQLFLNVHLFNTGSDDLSGISGVAAKRVDAAETMAEFTFAGTFSIDIQAGDPTPQASGTCAIEADGTILNWWPHMHQLGKHMLVEINGDPVHDQMFAFQEQINYPTNREVSAGDEITVTCDYHESDVDVDFGDSSNQEMCFVGFYRYPATGQDFCASGVPF
ncbi:MAG TPA: hypothetical protein VFU21_05805 [Kofleriaceae bacterium]|nr:hypothetical protein [Kofleriaceae bacterium]